LLEARDDLWADADDARDRPLQLLAADRREVELLLRRVGDEAPVPHRRVERPPQRLAAFLGHARRGDDRPPHRDVARQHVEDLALLSRPRQFRQLGEGEQVYFLPKPFSLQQLAGKVKEVMRAAP
jgi:hypothetical protein